MAVGRLQAKLLDDLRRMPMRGGGKRAHLAAPVRMVRARTGLRATGGRPGLAFDHDRHRAIDDAGAGERVEAKNGGGRQAATGGQAIGAPDLLAVELGKCVDEVAEQRRLRVLPAVPGWVTGAIAEAEVRREIDDRGGECLELVDFLA